MNALQTLAPARLALVLGLALTLTAVARGQDEEYATSSSADPESSGGFPWACFVISVAAIGGLYALVRRRQREAAAEGRWDRGPAANWYCRACDRDVGGPTCPRCRAANPFLDASPDDGPRPGRRGSRQGAPG